MQETSVDLSGLSDETDISLEPTTESVSVVTLEYENVSGGGKGQRPVIYLLCRNESGSRRVVTVEGFRPFFMITLSELRENPEKVVNDRHVRGVEVPEGVLSQDGNLSRFEHTTGKVYPIPEGEVPRSLEGDKLCKVFTNIPGDVGDLREKFDRTFAADIPFTTRFMVSAGIMRGCEIRTDKDNVRWENLTRKEPVREIEPVDAPEVEPRILTLDIEVATEGDGFPNVQRAKKPVTAVTAYDNYYDEYMLWYLDHPEWDERPSSDALAEHAGSEVDMDIPEENIHGFEREVDMLDAMSNWIRIRKFDILTGWNSSGNGGFDYPYLVNRCYNMNVWSIQEWSDQTFDSPFTVNKDDDKAEVVWPGMVLMDMLEGYKKTQHNKLESYTLEAIAQKEVDAGKMDLEGDLDENWRENPLDFLTYNLRDVEAVVDIERGKGIVSMFDNMRDVTGAEYDEMLGNNHKMIDCLFLHRSLEWGYALPTNTIPTESTYHGAYVFDPEPGVHEKCIYPDVASQYPTIMRDLNVSPETLYESMEAVRADGYTANDVYTAYVDKRDLKVVPKGEEVPDDIDTDKYKGVVRDDGRKRDPPGMFEPRYDEIYYLKPDVKEGFIGSVVDELIEMCNQYTGDLYDSVKTVRNSIYGVLGDSNTGNKGFRLFNHRLAESITLTGQRMIQYTADEYESYINDKHPEAEARIVGGDTDSCICTVPGAPDYETLLEWAEDASETVNGPRYDGFAQKYFDIPPEEHGFEVEVESIATRLFFVRDDKNPDVGVKKRYAQDIIWDDADGGTWYYDEDPIDRIDIKGFEAKRSDSSIATTEVQTDVLVAILTMDNPDRDEYILDRVSTYVDEARSGERPVEEIARPKGIGQNLEYYGWEVEEEEQGAATKKTKLYPKAKAGPVYRGAKYADTHFLWEDIGEGSKPYRLYLEGVANDDYPAAYEYEGEYDEESLEVGLPVDAIAVDHVNRLPDGFKIDYDKMVRKEVEEKLVPILETLGLDWGWIMGNGKQTGLGDF